MANPASSPKSRAIAHAAKGMMRNCAATPISTLFGTRATAAKSVTRSVNPMPSMINPSPNSMWGRNQVHDPGCTHAQTQPSTIHNGNALARAMRMRFNARDDSEIPPPRQPPFHPVRFFECGEIIRNPRVVIVESARAFSRGVSQRFLRRPKANAANAPRAADEGSGIAECVLSGLS